MGQMCSPVVKTSVVAPAAQNTVSGFESQLWILILMSPLQAVVITPMTESVPLTWIEFLPPRSDSKPFQAFVERISL